MLHGVVEIYENNVNIKVVLCYFFENSVLKHVKMLL